jgi:hypothetical protein
VVLNLAWIPFRKIFKTFYDFTDETKFGRNGVDERERERKKSLMIRHVEKKERRLR